MSRVFVFGIGGTGARVIKSLTFLLAAGVKCEREIVPVIIDIDKDNGDLTRTLQLLKWYNKIQRGISSVNSAESLKQDKKLFSNTITSWDNLGEGSEKEGSFHWNILDSSKSEHKNLQSFINYTSLEKSDREFIQALFSPQDLKLDLDRGFKGRPNIGSVILNSAFEDKSSYSNIINTFKEGDRAFFIGSLFGGTGAAGLPLLVKNFRNMDKSAINKAMLGGLLVLPYFDLETAADPTEESKIDSNQFALKTRAALAYYERTMYTPKTGFNSVYYVGDNAPQTTAMQNCSGAENQKNKASVIELAGALGIIDFANAPENNQQKTQFKEFGLKENKGNENLKQLNFQHFSEKTQSMINGSLIRLYLAAYFDEHLMDSSIKEKKPAWVRATSKMGLGQAAFVDANDFYESWSRFLKEFYGFLTELKTNGSRQFAPFELFDNAQNQTLNKLVSGVKAAPSFTFPLLLRKLNDEYLTYSLNKIVKKIKPAKNNLKPHETFVSLMNALVDKVYHDFYEEIQKKEVQQ